MTTALAPVPLTNADRCDRCGAQAYARVVLSSGADLLFCAHHLREHSDKLSQIAAAIHDERERLADATTSADAG